MRTPRSNGQVVKLGELDALMNKGMDVNEALGVLTSAAAASDENGDSDETQNDTGYHDYQREEEEYRKSRAGTDPRFRPLTKGRNEANNAHGGKRLFSNRTSILVPEKAVYPKVNFLCKQLGLAAGPPTLLIGISQSGKTFLAQDLALSVASGKPFLGGLTVGKGQVVHIDYEQGLEQSKVRYLRLMKGKGLAPSDLSEGDLDLYREVKKLDEPGADRELREKLAGKSLCIIDSLRASISGEKDENSSGIRETIDMLGAVSEDTGCTIIVLHHQGKGTVRDDRFAGRGSSAIFEAAGAAFQLEVTGEYPEKMYRLWQTKTRMGFAPELRYQLRDVGDHVEEIGVSEGIVLDPQVGASQSKKQTIEDKIVEALREKGELMAEGVYEAAKPVRKQAVKAARDKLVAEGLIDSKRRASDGREVYFLTSSGVAEE